MKLSYYYMEKHAVCNVLEVREGRALASQNLLVPGLSFTVYVTSAKLLNKLHLSFVNV